MFKTVRAQHGAGDLAAELEYTILPQSDDRSPSASSGDDEPQTYAAGHQQCSGHQQCRCQHHHRCRYHQQQLRGGSRSADSGGGGPGTRRTIIIILIMLVLGCGVVAAAVLVPILLAARLVSVPTSARLQTFAVAASGVIHSARGDYMPLLPIKTAAPGIVINFAQERPPSPPTIPPPPTNRRKRRSAAVAVAVVRPGTEAVVHVPVRQPRPRRRPVSDVRHRKFRTRPADNDAGSRLLDFRIRQ